MKINYPLVSVIIPFYSNKIWLNECIESILNQSYSYYEIILINDGSMEDISDLLELYKIKIKYFYISNSGPGKARNLGIEKANGKYIAFIDSDDLWLNNKLEEQVAYMEDTNVIWSHTNYIKFGAIKIRKKKTKINFEGDIFPKILITCPIATPCVMINRGVIIKDENFRFFEDIRYGEDSYFWLNLSLKYPLGFIHKHLTKVRIRGSNSALQALHQLKAKRSLSKILDNYKINFKKLQFFYAIKLGLNTCSLICRFLEKLENRTSKKQIELLSKLLYFFPYVYLKIFSLFLK